MLLNYYESNNNEWNFTSMDSDVILLLTLDETDDIQEMHLLTKLLTFKAICLI